MSIKNIYLQYTNWRWEIGFLDGTLDDIMKGSPLKVHWVKLPFNDRWFADPFILDYNDNEIIVLSEEFSDSIKRGRIAKLIIDRHTYQLKSWKIILDLDTHLSFPAIIRQENKVFVYPENSASGELCLYEYNPQDDSLNKVQCLSKEPLTDAIYTELFGGRKLLFSTQVPKPNTNVLDIREWDENKRGFKIIGKIEANEKTGRMAGDFFEINGKIYRPAQESNKEYGHSTVIQQIMYEQGMWNAREIRRMESPHPILKLGFHTFNHYKDLIVIDVKGYRYPNMGNFLKSVSSLMKKCI